MPTVLVARYRRSRPTAAFGRRRVGDAAGCCRLFWIERFDLHPGFSPALDLDVQSGAGFFFYFTRPTDVFNFDQSALAEAVIAREVDRYISMPGQALAYTMGKLKILEPRARAQEKLGDAFDIKAFHDVLHHQRRVQAAVDGGDGRRVDRPNQGEDASGVDPADRSFRILNMPSTEDLATPARIRAAAIACFGRKGIAATSVREIAEEAGVSPALIIHHFGSKEGLRAACDEHVIAAVRAGKTEAMATGPTLDVAAALRNADVAFLPYLIRILMEGSPQAAELVDEMASDAETYLQLGVESGMLKPSADPAARAALLTIWGIAALVLHEHVHRLLGADPLAPDFAEQAARYAGPALEIFSDGLLTEEAAAAVKEAFSETAERKERSE